MSWVRRSADRSGPALFFAPRRGDDPVRLPEGYVRKGRPLNFQIDHDAAAMLSEMVPTLKSHGRFLSELIRREYIRRQEWQRLRAAVSELVEVGNA